MRIFSAALILAFVIPTHAQQRTKPRPPVYTVVDGRVSDKRTWISISGNIIDYSGDTVLLEAGTDKIILKHYEFQDGTGGILVAQHTPVETKALKVAPEHWAGSKFSPAGTYETWDCGKPYVPSAADIEAARKQAADKMEADTIALRKKEHEAQLRAFRTVYSGATNGSPSMQYSLALRYLNGQGCETNKDEGIRWLKIASTNGSYEAASKLAALKVP
jgi:hypothetical protein